MEGDIVKMKPKLTKEQKEAQEIIKSTEKGNYKVHEDEKDILNWSAGELRVYVNEKIKGMGRKKKLLFGKNLIKRINDKKKKENKK